MLDDGSLLRLAGILWPDAGRTAHRMRLRAEMEALLIGESLLISIVSPPDRWRRRQAVIARTAPPPGEPSDIQSHLIASGLAAYWPAPREAERCAVGWQDAERQAREDRIGIWAPARRRAGRWRPQLPQAGAVALYEGRVHSVRTGRRMMFINFEGPRTKIPVWMLSQRQLKAFQGAGLDPATWAGKRLLVRAHVTGTGGRRLLVESPSQIAIIDGTAR